MLTTVLRYEKRVFNFLCLTVSQDVSVCLAICAHRVVLSPPSVALALFSPHLDSPLVTPVHQVIKKHTFVDNKQYKKQT